ncbi:MOLPALP family lipoprotein [Mesoplasma lactucae]|uniref:Uncharacterized protein n=1 Tax=Mesoplasma lactucae ATCC 49193 TaxID=81460 RepID=A0A291IR10_9MOLU|nr:MOLPALP family lipoprotein [Mesoplasma lactucae]ATG97213.1 hypothetical protein CP520_00335 [Mesoplasma lactucae ATCC 49193]ATZ20345.1 hypothetical protein MLACT_v1c05240 [Mesoplasma lactucae ATCC 49193]MCL8216516.1 hypothetical protein [Mesoplasma lactucae ATCC 49193]
MKKLLALLASITIVGSSASTVVACGINAYADLNDNGDDRPSGNNKDNGGNNEKPESGWSGDPGKRNPDNNNPDNGNSGNDNNGGNDNGNNPDDPNKNPDNKPETPTVMTNRNNILASFEQMIQKTIYQDQYGFDGNYLNQQLFSDSMSNWINVNQNNNIKSNLMGDEGDAKFKEGSSSDFINHYLNSPTENVNLNGDKGNMNAKPFNDFLPEKANKVINGINTYDEKFGVYSPTAILNAIAFVLNGLGIQKAADKVLSFKEQVLGITNPILNDPETRKIIKDIEPTTELNNLFGEMTIGDSQKSIINGVAWLLAIGVGDTAQINQFLHINDLSLYTSNASLEYLVNLIGDLNKTDDKGNPVKKIDANNYKEYILPKGIINKDNLKNLVQNSYSIFALFTGYLQAFSDYKVAAPKDANHIFSDNKTNWDVLSEVRNTKIKNATVGTGINVYSLVADLDYYLSDFKTDIGMYRIQAIFAIFCQDKDYNGSWKNVQGGKTLLLDWDDKKNNQLNTSVNTPIISLATKVLSQLINVEKVLKDAKVDWLVTLLGYPITNATLQQVFYQLFMNFSTQTQVQLSKGMYHQICEKGGFFSLLPYIDENWVNTLLNNPLKFLYKGDLISWLSNFTDNVKGTGPKSWLAAAGVSAAAKPGIEKVVNSLKPMANSNGQFNLQELLIRPLGELLNMFNAGLFDKNKYRFNPAFASFYTNKDISELADYLAIEMFNVNKMAKRAVYKNKAFDIEKIKPVLECLWDKNGNNIIDEFFNILEKYTGVNRINKLNNLFGYVGINKFDTDKLFGQLLLLFLPQLRDKIRVEKGKNVVAGDDKQTSPIIDTVVKIYKQFMEEINIPTNYNSALKLAYDNRRNEIVYTKNIELNENNLKGSAKVTYTWTNPNGTKFATIYTFEFSREKDTEKFKTAVTKEPVKSDDTDKK